MTNTLPSHVTSVLEPSDWQARVEHHRERARRWTQPALERRTRGQPHPIEDFLFDYYPFKLGKLEQWHPGIGVALRGSSADFPPWLRAHYREVDGCVFADPHTMTEPQRFRLGWTLDLLERTQSQSGHFGCFGMHEWAMVYRTGETRHGRVAGLRLNNAEIDRFVESRPIRCSHFDAFRFFTPAAKPLNSLQPTLEGRPHQEQPGCIHANMDLYKWCFKSLPWADGTLLLATLELAMELRRLDMRASPYDLHAYGCEPVRIETPEGRKEYEAQQRSLADRATPLRRGLIDVLRATLAATAA